MGIEFRESSLMIGPKTTATTRKGQVYNLNVGLSNLVNKDAKEKESKVYALFVGDTVCVNEVRNNLASVVAVLVITKCVHLLVVIYCISIGS